MTRLNLVPAKELMDQHLFAEWREIKMVPRSLRRSLRARRTPEAVLRMVPRTFRLGTGHVSFFYDKGAYLRRRYGELTLELFNRGTHKFDQTADWDSGKVYDRLPLFFWKDYYPTEGDMEITRERIAQRISERPDFYRMHGKPIN